MLNIERYEAKYHLTTEKAQQVRRWVQRWCDLDAACTDGPYLISTLYLDGPRLPLYRATKDREPRRFKLRVRRYETGEVFFEIKRRIKSMVHKTRVRIPKEDWAYHHRPRLDNRSLFSADKDARVLSEFHHRCARIQAKPLLTVLYAREAWVSPIDRYARVTLDQDIRACTTLNWAFPTLTPALGDRHQWSILDTNDRFSSGRASYVLELKCERHMPRWMSEMTRALDLSWRGFSKYGAAVERLHPSRGSIDRRTLSTLKPRGRPSLFSSEVHGDERLNR
jgi:hypothetical protein